MISDEMKDLIIKYMEACNAGDYALADTIMIELKKLRE